MNYRVSKLKEYLFEVIQDINTNAKDINVNALSKDINSYSLDKIPTASTVEKWINSVEIHKDVYSFRNRVAYSYDVINNLNNIGFFETFEALISSNNKKGILPDIENIESIECLNCGTVSSIDTNTAELNIQIQIIYIVK